MVVERAADGVFAGLVLVVALLALPDGTPGIGLLRVGGLVVTAAFAAVIAFLVFAYRSRAAAVRLARAALHPLSEAVADRAAAVLDAFIHGLRVLPGGRSVALFFGLTALYWALVTVGMAVLASGFGFHLGVAQACALVGVLVVGVMIPAGPGMIGTFQGAILVGLSLFAPAQDVATRGMAYANVLWAAQIAQVTALGVPFLFSRHVDLGRLTGAGAAMEQGLEAEETEYRSAGMALSESRGGYAATSAWRSARSRSSAPSTSSRKRASSSRSIRARYSSSSEGGSSSNGSSKFTSPPRASAAGLP